ncbi:MAG: hypothetical protein MJE68_19530 [Proteobacteria bacterium]|nr:hypothetical protein [Pseudomonadota bacterium]
MACLPTSTFDHVRSIYEQYAHGSLKGQKVSKAKQASAKQPDLKGSNFKCVRGMDPNTVHTLLTEISEGKLSLTEFASECTSVKQMGKVQAGFVKATNCENWEDAKSKFPLFTTSQQLEPFKLLNFNAPTLPQEFMRFCQNAMKKVSAAGKAVSVYDGDDVYVVERQTVGLFWKHELLHVNADSFSDMFSKVSTLLK